MCQQATTKQAGPLTCQVAWVSRRDVQGTYDTRPAVALAKFRMTGEVWPVCREHIEDQRLTIWVHLWEMLPLPGQELPEDLATLARFAGAKRERELAKAGV